MRDNRLTPEIFEEKLKDCPFCGNRPRVKYIGNERTKKRQINVKCSNSGCRIERTDAALRHGFGYLEQIAIDGWNMRNQAQERTP